MILIQSVIFTNNSLNLNQQGRDFIKLYGLESQYYKYSDYEITDLFLIHILHSNDEQTYYNFDFLRAFKFAKETGLGQNFNEIFYNSLKQNDTNLFTREENSNPGKYGVYCYISQSICSILLSTDSHINEICNTWYKISKNNVLNVHPPSWKVPSQQFVERVVRLFYGNKGLGKLDIEFMLTPRSEIELYTQIKEIKEKQKNIRKNFS